MVELESSIVSALTKWCREGLDYFVGVDIGGTNTRISIGTIHEYKVVYTFKASSTRAQLERFSLLAGAVAQLFDSKGASGAALAGAGRLLESGDVIDVTNFPGGEEHRLLRKNELPEVLFPRGRTRFLNDLQSASYGIIALSRDNQLQRYFQRLWGSGDHKSSSSSSSSSSNGSNGLPAAVDPSLVKQHYLIVAPGTGLGASLLLWFYGSNRYTAMPLEAGHSVVTPLSADHEDYDDEQKLFAFVSRKCYGGAQPPEWEDIVCGQGLVNLYEWLCERDGAPAASERMDAGDVGALAARSDERASHALYLFYRYLARFSANLAIVSQAGGVLWTGSNQVANDAFVRANRERIRADFFAHPKHEWLEDVGIIGQVAELNVNLLGCLLIARRFADTSAAPSSSTTAMSGIAPTLSLSNASPVHSSSL
jgi:glucokinase